MAKLPTIPDDLKLLAQPYTDGQKMPDQRFALILRIALLTEENAALSGCAKLLRRHACSVNLRLQRWMNSKEQTVRPLRQNLRFCMKLLRNWLPRLRCHVSECNDRVQQLLAEERKHPTRWWYLSFCEGQFLGAVILRAPGLTTAILRCSQLGLNPGGEVIGVNIPDGQTPPPQYRERLLSKADLFKIFGRLARVDSGGNLLEELEEKVQ